MRAPMSPRFALAALTALVVSSLLPPQATADPITFSGTVTYQGTYSGDTLYVAVLDTVGVEDVTILDLQAIAVGPPPISEPYTLDFDNTGVSAELLIASFLDVDGGGVDDVGGADVFGWFGEGLVPQSVSSTASQSGLDFALPEAEIYGVVTLAAGQPDARVDVSNDLGCMTEGFRPGTFVMASGPYAIIGVYAGSYCVSADGSTRGGSVRVCYGDPTCVSPTPVTVGATDVATGIDLDFTAISPVERRSWGEVKAQYR